jgi:hypothetical protein
MKTAKACERERDGRAERLSALAGILAEGAFALALFGVGYVICLALSAA